MPDNSKLPSLDREAFQAWATSPVTRWVLNRRRDQATEQSQMLGEQLLGLVAGSPTQLREAQPELAYLRGRFDEKAAMAVLEYEQLLTENELQAVRDAEEQAKRE